MLSCTSGILNWTSGILSCTSGVLNWTGIFNRGWLHLFFTIVRGFSLIKFSRLISGSINMIG